MDIKFLMPVGIYPQPRSRIAFDLQEEIEIRIDSSLTAWMMGKIMFDLMSIDPSDRPSARPDAWQSFDHDIDRILLSIGHYRTEDT